MKLTTQLAIVIVVGILSLVAMVLSLALWADWQEGSIAGLVSGFAAVFIGIIAALRNQQKASSTLEDQSETLDRIATQTNGKSDAQLQAVADRAAVKVLEALRRPDGSYPRLGGDDRWSH